MNTNRTEMAKEFKRKLKSLSNLVILLEKMCDYSMVYCVKNKCSSKTSYGSKKSINVVLGKCYNFSFLL